MKKIFRDCLEKVSLSLKLTPMILEAHLLDIRNCCKISVSGGIPAGMFTNPLDGKTKYIAYLVKDGVPVTEYKEKLDSYDQGYSIKEEEEEEEDIYYSYLKTIFKDLPED